MTLEDWIAVAVVVFVCATVVAAVLKWVGK